MFYEFALDPSVLNDVSRCRTFFESFDRSSRLIADAPKNWIRDAFDAINQIPHDQCGPNFKKNLKEKLRKLLNRNLLKNRHSQTNSESLPWNQFAAIEHKSYPFSAILGLNAESDPVRIFDFENILFEPPECWQAPTQKHVERNASAIVDVMESLLCVSKSIHLVDPHFTFTMPAWERFGPILKEIISRSDSYNFGKGIKSISIHTSDKFGNMSNELRTVTQRWLPEGIEIKVSHWAKATMHDRFLLTDVGGLNYGHGLDESGDQNSQTVLVTVLDHVTYRGELQKIIADPLIHYRHQK